MSVAEEHTLKLYVADDGTVWYADGTGVPKSARCGVSEFLDGNLLNYRRNVRVLGTSNNVELIVRLYEGKGSLLSRLEVASPLLCETTAQRRDPEVALFRMRQCLLNPALGGWHVFTEKDYPSYAIASRLSYLTAWPDPAIRNWLWRHPVWFDLQFIRGLDELSVARVIGLMLDPRWYVDPKRPYRGAKLDRFLGLEPIVQQVVTGGHALLTTESQRRCFTVWSAWYGSDPPGEAERQIPGNFLWRLRQTHRPTWRGDLRASQMFTAFLRNAWLQGMTDRLDLFDGERLLAPDDYQAYREHRQQVRQSLAG